MEVICELGRLVFEDSTKRGWEMIVIFVLLSAKTEKHLKVWLDNWGRMEVSDCQHPHRKAVKVTMAGINKLLLLEHLCSV